MRNKQTPSSIAGLSAIGALVIGVVSFFAGLFPLLHSEFVAAGVLWIGSAISFGLLANAVFRE